MDTTYRAAYCYLWHKTSYVDYVPAQALNPFMNAFAHELSPNYQRREDILRGMLPYRLLADSEIPIKDLSRSLLRWLQFEVGLAGAVLRVCFFTPL